MTSFFRPVPVALALMAAVAPAQALAQRAEFTFNDGWRMATGEIAGAEAPGFDDAAWKPVTMPRAWNEDEAFKVDIHDLKGGITWYRKRFVLPAGAHDVAVRLRDTARAEGFDHARAERIALAPEQHLVIGFRPDTGFVFR